MTYYLIFIDTFRLILTLYFRRCNCRDDAPITDHPSGTCPQGVDCISDENCNGGGFGAHGFCAYENEKARLFEHG